MTFIKRIDRKVRRSDSRPIQRDTDLVNDVVTQMMGTESAWLKTPSRLGMPEKRWRWSDLLVDARSRYRRRAKGS